MLRVQRDAQGYGFQPAQQRAFVRSPRDGVQFRHGIQVQWPEDHIAKAGVARFLRHNGDAESHGH